MNKILMSSRLITIANEVIALKDNKLTIMQLLKLIYIAHGYCLALLDTPLVHEEVEAWPYGPVIRSLYSKVKEEQGINITKPLSLKEPISLSKDEIKVIETVVEGYREKNGWDLSILTHEPNSAWSQTVEKKGFYSVIPQKLIKDYYHSLVYRD